MRVIYIILCICYVAGVIVAYLLNPGYRSEAYGVNFVLGFGLQLISQS
jgi:hypothetical protein